MTDLAQYIIDNGPFEVGAINPIGDATADEINGLWQHLLNAKQHKGSIKLLQDMLKETQQADYVSPFVGATLVGIRMCIRRLEQGGDE